MSYLNVITLQEAKNYLRIDDGLTDDDGRITSMIKASLMMLEKATNVIVYPRDKDYYLEDFCAYVYDYPINNVVSTDTLDVTEKALYSIYNTNDSSVSKITLNVGYTDVANVPSDIIETALYMLKYMYFEAETDKVSISNFPMWIQVMIMQNKRFIL